MRPNAVIRLPAALSAAARRLGIAARLAGERTVESLGLAALTAASAADREALLVARAAFTRKAGAFALAFDAALEQRLRRELAAVDADGPAPDARALEIADAVERFALAVAPACGWELRELGAYLEAAPDRTRTGGARHPLRPEVVGHALYRAIDAVADRDAGRGLLADELARSLGATLRPAYAEIIADLQRAGHQPAGLATRGAAAHSGSGGAATASSAPRASSQRRRAVDHSEASLPNAARATLQAGFDPGMTSLLQRLARTGDASAAPTNLVAAHREELRRVALGPRDRRVVDVVDALVTEILADPALAPPVARQLARLQWPLLRAALGDPSFFSTRHHPVRRFIDRVAALGAAFDGFPAGGADPVLARIVESVDGIVASGLQRVDLGSAAFDESLAALDDFVAGHCRDELRSFGRAGPLLAAKDDDARRRRLHASRLEADLRDLPVPGFVRDFVARVWSQVVVTVTARDGCDSETVRRLRTAGRDLVLGVLPQPSAEKRKAFVAALPRLMKEIDEGLALIGWPDEAKRAFFDRLLPAQAAALKARQQRPPDLDRAASAVDAALQRPLPPTPEPDAGGSGLHAPDDDAVEPPFGEDETRCLGVVDAGDLGHDGEDHLAGEPQPLAALAALAGTPAAEPPEPVSGRALGERLELGSAYRMRLGDGWLQARLVHVGAASGLHVFVAGSGTPRLVTLTRRTLLRLCAAGRLRTLAGASLLERAAARAQRRLAAAGAGG